MCDKCEQLDSKIEHYQKLLLGIADQLTGTRQRRRFLQRAHQGILNPVMSFSNELTPVTRGYRIARLAFEARYSGTRQLIFECGITVTRCRNRAAAADPV
jgi:hypothetical protein